MNALNRRITLLFVVVNLVVVGVLPAQDISDEQINRAVAAKQAEVAQKQTEAAQKQAETAQRQVLLTSLAGVEASNVIAPQADSTQVGQPSFSVKSQSPWSLGTGGAGSVLVIPTAELKTEELVTMTVDMSVMSRLFEKNLEQARIPTARGSLFVSSHDPFAALLGGGSAMQSMYLQGYGALFLMKVDFPLSPPPEAKEEEKQAEEKEQGDPVWEQMRRDMYEPQEASRRTLKERQQKYDAVKVENLKTTLVKALKHAVNIRSLKQDELVILAVAGSGESAGETAMITTRSAIVVDGNTRIAPQQSALRGSSQTVLIIRAKKSDIDSFAKNADYEQFRQRIQLFSCPCLGAEAGRGDSFGLSQLSIFNY